MRQQIRLFALASVLLGPLAFGDPVTAPPSTITITFKQMNVPVDATFNKFVASIDFDPAKPAAAKANFTINIASFDLGAPEYNSEVLKPDWFDAAHFPSAMFSSTSLKVVSASQLEASGQLTIKGVSQTVTFPVTIKDDGKTRSYDGTLHIKRSAFNVGVGEWKDTDVVADDVAIKVHAVATKK